MVFCSGNFPFKTFTFRREKFTSFHQRENFHPFKKNNVTKDKCRQKNNRHKNCCSTNDKPSPASFTREKICFQSIKSYFFLGFFSRKFFLWKTMIDSFFPEGNPVLNVAKNIFQDLVDDLYFHQHHAKDTPHLMRGVNWRSTSSVL